MFQRIVPLFSVALAARLLIFSDPAQAAKPPSPTAGPKYTVLLLPSEDTDGREIAWSQPRGMNNWGNVVGLACWPEGVQAGDGWEPGEFWEVFLYTATDGMRNLNDIIAIEGARLGNPILDPNWRLIDAGDINDDGQIVGTAEYRMIVKNDQGEILSVEQDWGVFRYSPGSETESPTVEIIAPSTEDGEYMEATSINGLGEMILHEYYDNGGHPCVYASEVFTPIPAPINGIGVWKANAINDSGQIAGNARIGGYVNAVRYSPNTHTTVSLGWLKNPGRTPMGQANDVNRYGQVTGWTTTGGGTAGHAFRFTDVSGMKDLGALGTSDTKGYGINDHGDVVGNATTSRRAFVYTDTYGMVDLTAAVVNLPTDWTQMQARRINNAGVILGSLRGDRGQACLFVKVP